MRRKVSPPTSTTATLRSRSRGRCLLPSLPDNRTTLCYDDLVRDEDVVETVFDRIRRTSLYVRDYKRPRGLRFLISPYPCWCTRRSDRGAHHAVYEPCCCRRTDSPISRRSSLWGTCSGSRPTELFKWLPSKLRTIDPLTVPSQSSDTESG